MFRTGIFVDYEHKYNHILKFYADLFGIPTICRHVAERGARLFSSEREKLAGEYYNRTCEMIQFTSGSADTEMMVSFLVDACHNTTKVTRRRCVPPFSGKNTFSNGNVAEVLTWKWWPHAARDLDPPSTCDKL